MTQTKKYPKRPNLCKIKISSGPYFNLELDLQETLSGKMVIGLVKPKNYTLNWLYLV